MEYDIDDPRHPDNDGGIGEAITIIAWVFGMVLGIPAVIGLLVVSIRYILTGVI